MHRLLDRMTLIIRPLPRRSVESTRSELAAEIHKRRAIGRKTEELARILDDYRKQDGALSR